MPRKKLLVVDDDQNVREGTQLAFEDDFEVFEAPEEKAALLLFDSENPDVVLLDLYFYGVPKGWGIMRKMRKKKNNVIIFLMSGMSHERNNPMSAEADGFFDKPFDPEEVRALLIQRGVLS